MQLFFFKLSVFILRLGWYWITALKCTAWTSQRVNVFSSTVNCCIYSIDRFRRVTTFCLRESKWQSTKCQPVGEERRRTTNIKARQRRGHPNTNTYTRIVYFSCFLFFYEVIHQYLLYSKAKELAQCEPD